MIDNNYLKEKQYASKKQNITITKNQKIQKFS